jgi:hypothetical protein
MVAQGKTLVGGVLASALGLSVLLVGIVAAEATESETISAAESESEPPVLTTTFVSPTNGFSVKHLDRGREQ